jgi:hypothetical protein
MHTAPAVRMSLAHGLAWDLFVISAACLAAANMAAWAGSWAQASIPTVALAALLAGGATGGMAMLLLRRRGTARGVLTWDGACWQWSPDAVDPCAGEVHVMVDLGAWMLLRFTPSAPTVPAAWLGASRRDAAAMWPAGRAALYSHRPNSDLPAATDSA